MKSKCLNYLDNLITGNTTKKELDIIEYIKKCVKEKKEEKSITAGVDWLPYFEKLWKLYGRHVNRQLAMRTFEHKIRGLTEEECREKCNLIYKLQMVRQKQWKEEDRDKKYYPHYSTFLNNEVPNSKYYKGK